MSYRYEFPSASYDAWKTRSPDDEWPEEEYEEDFMDREDRISERLAALEKQTVSAEYRRAREVNNGKRVRILIDHAFKDDQWIIFGPAPEPGWYYCHCVSRCRTASGLLFRAIIEYEFHETEVEILE